MSKLSYYLGPWQWRDSPMPSWRPPVGTRGAIDLGSLSDHAKPGHDRPWGFFATTATMPSEYALLGVGDLREIKVDGFHRSLWQSVLGHAPDGDTLADLLWHHLTEGADHEGLFACGPLVPTHQLMLELHLPGHGQPIKQERFEWGKHKHTAKLQRLLQAGFEQQFHAVAQGHAREGHHQRWLDASCKKYRVTDWQALVPKPLRAHVPGPLPHETTITEGFFKASGVDDPGLGSDLTWTVNGNWRTLSSYAIRSSGSDGLSFAARAESDLSSADHYAQIVAVTENNGLAQGPCCRFSTGTITTGANQNFYCVYNFGSNTTISKIVAGSQTDIDTDAYTTSAGDTYKVSASGSTITGYVNGTTRTGPTTDTTLTSNVRTGITSYSVGGHLDSFQAADLGGSPPVAVNDTATAVSNVAKTINVLSNDTLNSATTLAVVSSGGNSATVTVNTNSTASVADDSITYTAPSTFIGTDTFSYSISDGSATSSATVTVTVSGPAASSGGGLIGNSALISV